MKWFRLYNEIIDDPKIAKMTPKMFKVFIFLLCLASEVEQNGVIPFSRKDLSWRLRMPIREINTHINGLKELNILVDNPVLSLINWDKRQFASDSSKERVKRYRKKQCNVTVTSDVTPQNRTDTEQNRTEQIQTSTFLSDSIEYRLANYLFKFIFKRNNKYKKPDLQKWAKQVDLMLRIDKRKSNDIKAVIEWCQNDTPDKQPEGNWKGWSSNILSTVKLREKFDVLFIKMQESISKSKHDPLTEHNLNIVGKFLKKEGVI